MAAVHGYRTDWHFEVTLRTLCFRGVIPMCGGYCSPAGLRWESALEDDGVHGSL